ncbi:uncharacterized protein LOC127791236 isoform X8 [Diospyros lotus]|uniref:uncharacterized protein LOC127791236 isoform X8 n=1 Tax=Diospyros lotus TaxID=55363 RepID=UPI00225516C5|nr:uncharacterized protein LOC127791236 isoform X8 [Diospyros lotus]
MELKGKFMTQFKVRQQPPELTAWVLGKRAKRQSLVVLSVFRETYPVSHSKWKTLEVHCDNGQSIWQSAVSRSDNSKLAELSFNRLQLSDQEYKGLQKRYFGRFVAREAVLDEEYWTAAWLRAEAHWESMLYMRHVDSYKRKYAEQEFYALKRRCTGRDGNSLKCFCFVAEVKRLSATLASHGPFDAHKYAYVANACVSKFARRQGVASNMLYLAADFATMAGMNQLFVHVNADNKPAQELYKKTGFKIVEVASSPLSKDQRLLMSMEL